MKEVTYIDIIKLLKKKPATATLLKNLFNKVKQEKVKKNMIFYYIIIDLLLLFENFYRIKYSISILLHEFF